MGASNLVEIEHTAVPLLRPFTGAGEGAVWKQILRCFPPADCGDERSNLFLGVDLFTSIVR